LHKRQTKGRITQRKIKLFKAWDKEHKLLMRLKQHRVSAKESIIQKNHVCFSSGLMDKAEKKEILGHGHSSFYLTKIHSDLNEKERIVLLLALNPKSHSPFLAKERGSTKS